MRNPCKAFLLARALVVLGAVASFAFQSSDAFAAKSQRKPPGDRDAEELDRPGDMADWMHSQRAYPAAALPDSIYFTGWAEWTAVTQQAPFRVVASDGCRGPSATSRAGSTSTGCSPRTCCRGPDLLLRTGQWTCRWTR